MKARRIVSIFDTTMPARTPVPPAISAGRPRMERQAIVFTLGLYLFICAAVITVHLFAGALQAAPAEESEGKEEKKSSSTSPYNP